jgi:hypothetical protein
MNYYRKKGLAVTSLVGLKIISLRGVSYAKKPLQR